MSSPARLAAPSDEIRAIPVERLVDAPLRVLPFVPRIEMTLDERLQRLRAHDPRSADMLVTALDKLYALTFPDDAR